MALDPSALIARVVRAREAAQCGEADSPDVPLDLEPAMSDNRVRLFLRALVADAKTYLELGLFGGSTFVPATWGRRDLLDAIGIDNFTTPLVPSDELRAKLKANLSLLGAYDWSNNDLLPRHHSVSVYDMDIYGREAATLRDQISKRDVLFYDAGHSVEAQWRGLAFWAAAMADPSIIIVDDYAAESVRRGCLLGLQRYVCHHAEALSFYNGLGVFVVSPRGEVPLNGCPYCGWTEMERLETIVICSRCGQAMVWR